MLCAVESGPGHGWGRWSEHSAGSGATAGSAGPARKVQCTSSIPEA